MFRSRRQDHRHDRDQNAARHASLPADPNTLDRDLEHLISEYSALIYHVAYGIVHDRGMAEDVVQETMIKAWKHSGDFRGDSSIKTWLVRIGRNAAIDAQRRRRDQITGAGTLPDSADTGASSDVERVAQGRESVHGLSGALDQLDELSRTIFVLREVDSLSYQEISDALEIPISTVKTRLLRTRKTLQVLLRERPVATGGRT